MRSPLFALARQSGFSAALEEAGLASDLVVSTGAAREDGLAAGLTLLAMNHPPTAIATATDVQAFGVYEAARRYGVSIPDELSVIGYDDVPTAKWLVPPLTTVRQPVVLMAEQAARMLFARMSGRPETLPQPCSMSSSSFAAAQLPARTLDVESFPFAHQPSSGGSHPA